MRRASVLVFALLLALSLTAAAFGEATITSVTVTATGYSNSFNAQTHTVALETADGCYLFDATGAKLTETPYDDIRRDYSSTYYVVTKAGKKGVIDSEGKVIIPARYGDVEVVSDRWAYAVTLIPTGTDQGDYYYTSSGSKVYYNVDTCDVYYCGAMVGSLPRSGIDTDSYASAYGDYLQIKDRNGTLHHYNKEFVDSGINEYGESAYANRHYTHTGTGQILWDPGCTLTADEVDQIGRAHV